jgi:DNA-binding FrmR family transcriptional regulator
MGHVVHDKARLLARARRLRGQVESVERALDAGADCADVLQQLAAVRGAANGLMAIVLEGHVREHMGVRRNRDTDAFLDVVRRYLK